jgi:RNA-directed DNA polymerase
LIWIIKLPLCIYTGKVFKQITSFKNLLRSYYQARRNKRTRTKLLKFELNFEDRLIDIGKQIEDGSYRPKQYHQFQVYEPKLRQISAPALIDRVAHHAIVNVIEPVIDRRFTDHTFACRKGKGGHLCLLKTTVYYKKIAKKYKIFYALKCDIKSYFSNIDHRNLINFLAQSIKCIKTLKLLTIIIGSYQDSHGKGIPIGNLTSQLFANVYLHPLDVFVTQKLNEKNYFRYMDDFVVISADKNYLIDLRTKIKNFLEQELKLQLHPKKSNIFRADRGLDFVGFMIKPTGVTKRKKTLRRYKKRHKKRLKRLQKYKNQLKEKRKTSQLALFESNQIVDANEEELTNKITALQTKLRISRNSFKGFLQYSQFKRLKSGGVEINGIIIPKIFSKKK